jgi:glutamate dehydrogenase (NAD(P)+)
MITGKPLTVGGSLGRDDATARGGVYTVREAGKHLNLDLSKATAAVQGYGNAGSFAAILSRGILGSKIVAVSDTKGGIYDSKGLDPHSVLKFKQETGSVVGYPGTKPISNKDILELDVDVLWPSALENVITAENAPRVKAKIVAEAANGPTTPEAEEILEKKGVFIIPDFLCNAGGVTVSYFEWVQNIYGYYWTAEEVHQKLDLKMTKAFNDTLQTAREFKVGMTSAAYIVAVRRVAEAMQVRGWVTNAYAPTAAARAA